MRIVLLHGGLWEPMDADGFWHRTGIAAGLTRRGLEVVAPDRLARAASWDAEVEHLAPLLPRGPSVLLGACNASGLAVSLARRFPTRVSKVVLAWPLTAGDADRDARVAARIAAEGLHPEAVAGLLAGGLLRGACDGDIAALPGAATAVVRAPAASPSHRPETADALLRLVDGATDLGVFAEPPTPMFAPQCDDFCDALAQWCLS
ncbi:MAG TPA: hypothetical protein VE172_18585 [Stackebrandtia sp.]|uniref:hypothetical protein n=1 Tax=Stackebrandtia sp. TaxID=2023065 RepID=UPI002D2C5EF5|nr:hypothetical protein [Stackebrandtia sp.]HZE40813.1 hypothetical protein [Stackebrandtia sp.]